MNKLFCKKYKQVAEKNTNYILNQTILDFLIWISEGGQAF